MWCRKDASVNLFVLFSNLTLWVLATILVKAVRRRYGLVTSSLQYLVLEIR